MAQGQRLNQVNDFKRNCQIITPIQITISNNRTGTNVFVVAGLATIVRLAACPGNKIASGGNWKGGSKEVNLPAPTPISIDALKSGKWSNFYPPQNVGPAFYPNYYGPGIPPPQNQSWVRTTFATQPGYAPPVTPWFCQ